MGILRADATELTEIEMTNHPVAALRRRGIVQRHAEDCVQNPRAGVLRGATTWQGLSVDETWPPEA